MANIFDQIRKDISGIGQTAGKFIASPQVQRFNIPAQLNATRQIATPVLKQAIRQAPQQALQFGANIQKVVPQQIQKPIQKYIAPNIAFTPQGQQRFQQKYNTWNFFGPQSYQKPVAGQIKAQSANISNIAMGLMGQAPGEADLAKIAVAKTVDKITPELEKISSLAKEDIPALAKKLIKVRNVDEVANVIKGHLAQATKGIEGVSGKPAIKGMIPQEPQQITGVTPNRPQIVSSQAEIGGKTPQGPTQPIIGPQGSGVLSEKSPPFLRPSKGIVPQGANLTKVEAKKVAANLGLEGKTPIITTGKKTLGVIKTVQESPQTTPELSSIAQGMYNKGVNKDALAAAEKRIATDAPNAYHYALTNHNPEANTTAILLAKQYEAAGQPEMAANLLVEKAKQALQAGQGNQIYAMWDKLSPETVGQTAARTIENYNAKATTKIPALTTEQYQHFVDMAKKIQGMGEGKDKDMATQLLLQEIGRLIPSGLGDKSISLWRAGLLTGFRTPGKILLSHTISNTAETVKNIPASIIDRTLSMFTKKRGMTFTTKGIMEGGRQGISAGVDNLIHGYNAPTSGGIARDFTNQVNFGNSLFGRIAQKYVDTVSRLHGSLYKPFFGSAHLNSLYDQALTEGGNQGLKGQALESFVKDFVANPPLEAADKAMEEAKYVTFQNKTVLSDVAQSMTRKAPFTRVIAPFTQIPSSIAMKLVDYSPVGAVKTIIENIGKGKFDQRALSQGLGRSITGTGLMAIGGALYAKGMMTLGYPTTPSERAQWKAEGKIENAIKIGGAWRQLASFGPTGDDLAMGGNFIAGMQSGDLLNALQTAGAGGVQTIANSPYLQGIETLTSAMQDPAGKAQGMLKSYLGSLIPTGIANIATATDIYQRQANNPLEAMANKVPFWRETNLPQINVLGQPVPRAQGLIGTLFDPTYGSADISTPVTNEIQRLRDSGNAVSLSPLTKTQTINGQQVTLNPAELNQLQAGIGKIIQQQVDDLISTPNYQSLTDELKAKAIDKIITTVKDQYKLSNADIIGGTPTGKPVTVTAKTIKMKVPKVKKAKTLKLAKAKKGKSVKIKAPKLAKAKFPKVKVKSIKMAKAKQYKTKGIKGIKLAKLPEKVTYRLRSTV